MPLIVHVGMHKTASSWLQRHVWPLTPGHRYADEETVRRVLLGGDAFDFDPAAARAALGVDDDPRPLIISEEDLSGVLHNGVVSSFLAKEIATRLQRTVPEARIVLFTRAQPSAAVSWYLQYLREGGTASLARYLFPDNFRWYGHHRPFKHPRFHWSQLDYIGLIEHYDALFGRERVLVLPYEELRRDLPGTLAAMGAALGVELQADRAGARNSGFRRGLVPLLRAANLFTKRSVPDKWTLLQVPYWYPVRKALFEQLNRVPLFGPRPKGAGLLGDEVRAVIAERFWRSNRRLAERMGRDLGTLGYPVDPPERAGRAPAISPLLEWVRH